MDKKYSITYSNGALKVLDDMKEKYDLESREETLGFALLVLKRLHENGTVSLAKNYEYS